MSRARCVSSLLRSLVALGALGACTPTPPPVVLEPTYANVAAVFESSCSFRSCHGGTGAGAARLNFERARLAGVAYDTLLVGVPSCMYDAMPLVDPGHPENSWLMIKVAGAHTGTALDFTPAADWDPGLSPRPDGLLPPSVCPLTVRGVLSFGTLMPQGSSAGLDAARADLIRRWILVGAPGRDGAVGPRDAGPADSSVPPADGAPEDGGEPADAPSDPDAAPLADGGPDTDADTDAGAESDGGPAIDAP